MRVCSKCGEAHPEAFFNKDRSRPDGLYPQCKNCSRANCRHVYVKYQPKHMALKRAWKNDNREQHAAINKAYRERHPDRTRAYTAAYRARLLQATPPWASMAALEDFKEDCPPGYHVDHEIPLKGRNVCGLNVPANWQYLPAQVSFKKGNRMPDEFGGYSYL